MASWLDKITKVADRAVNAVTEAANNTVKTYQEKGLDGIVDKTGEILVKTGETVTKAAEVAADKTQSYFKDIGQTNKELMNEVEENVGKGTIGGKIAGGLAATANTTQTMAEDLVNLTKRTYQNLVDQDGNKIDVVGNLDGVNRDVAKPTKETVDQRFQRLNAMPLEEVLSIIKADKRENGKWVDVTGTTFLIHKDSWFSPNNSIGGKNAVSLMNYHLSKVTNLDYHNSAIYKELTHETLNILDSYTLNASVQPVATQAEKDIKEQEVKGVKVDEQEGVVKKSRKPAVKKAETKAEVKDVKPATKKAVASKDKTTTKVAKKSTPKVEELAVNNAEPKPVAKKRVTKKVETKQENEVTTTTKRRKP